MSLVPRSLYKIRIIAVTLTHTKFPSSHGKADSKYNLTYYQFQLSSPERTTSDKARVKFRWLPEEGIANFIQSKATAIWIEFGKSKKGSWKACLCSPLLFFSLLAHNKVL